MRASGYCNLIESLNGAAVVVLCDCSPVVVDLPLLLVVEAGFDVVEPVVVEARMAPVVVVTEPLTEPVVVEPETETDPLDPVVDWLWSDVVEGFCSEDVVEPITPLKLPVLDPLSVPLVPEEVVVASGRKT